MKSLVIGLVVLLGAATQANAQFAPPSGGEIGSFLKCFYECKPGPNVQGVGTYQEITTLMLTNQSPDPRTAEVLSKVLLLARDKRIQDPNILDQIRGV